MPADEASVDCWLKGPDCHTDLGPRPSRHWFRSLQGSSLPGAKIRVGPMRVNLPGAPETELACNCRQSDPQPRSRRLHGTGASVPGQPL